jgi:hypothetical protein
LGENGIETSSPISSKKTVLVEENRQEISEKIGVSIKKCCP